MKRVVLLFLLILPIMVSAYLDWDSSGVPVMQNKNIQYSVVNEVCTDNTDILLWLDSCNGYYGVYAQKITAEGQFLWDEPVQVDEGITNCINPQVAALSNGHVIVTWIEYINDEQHVKMQRLDSVGYKLWNNVEIDFDYNINQSSMELIANNDDSVFFLWSWNDVGSYKTGLVKITSQGEIHPDFDSYNYDYYGYGEFSAVSDNSNGIYLTCKSMDLQDLYINNISETGERLWGYWGQLAVNGDVSIREFRNVAGDNRVYLIESKNDGVISIYLFDNEGESEWDQPITLYANEYYDNKIDAVNNDDNTLSICWTTGQQVLLQKINNSGDLLYGDYGILLFTPISSYQSGLTIDHNDEGNFVLFRENNQLNYAFIDYAGIIQYSNTNLLTINYHRLSSPNLTCVDNLFHVSFFCSEEVTWSQYSIKNQLIDNTGNPVFDDDGVIVAEGLYKDIKEWFTWNINGDAYYLYSMETESYQIILQKLNGEGEKLYGPEGLVIYESDSINKLNALFDEDSENIVITWTQSIDSIYEIAKFMEINLAGSTQVEAMTISFGDEFPASRIEIMPISSEYNSYLLCWYDFYNWMYPTVKSQKIAGGSIVWQEGAKDLCSEDTCNSLVFTGGNFIVIEIGSWPYYDYKIKHLDADGLDPLWPEEGITLNLDSYRFDFISSENSLLVFETQSSESIDNIVLYEIDQFANFVTPEEGLILLSDEIVSFESAAVDEENLYLTWRKYSSSTVSLIAQKYDQNLNPLWTDDGKVIEFINTEDATYSLDDNCLKIIGEDLLIGWISSNGFSDNVLRTQMLSPEGDFMLSYPEVWVCSVEGVKNMPVITTYNNEAVFSWLDRRSEISDYCDISLYAQKLSLPMTNQDEDIIQGAVSSLNNYPNPFNPTTNINFSIVESGNVTLEIFNIKGQKVKTLIDNEFKESGNHSVSWVGTDDYDNSVTSGVYLCRMISRNQSLTKKMILMK